MVCDKCGTSNVRPKQIVSKKTNQTYTVFECLDGCMNGAYKYSCFSPKVQPATQPAPQQATRQAGQPTGASMLKMILQNQKVMMDILDEIIKKVNIQNGEPISANLTDSELQPDDVWEEDPLL